MTALLSVAGVLCGLVCAGANMDEGVGAVDVEAESIQHTFRLDPVDSGLSVYCSVRLEGHEFAFQKEPAFEGSAIRRFALPVGKDNEAAIGAAWDCHGVKLYLDLNRNLDLTDDPSGVYVGQDETYQQVFEGVRFSLSADQPNITYVCKVRFIKSWWPIYCQVTVESGWQAVAELNGRPWRISFGDNLDGMWGDDDVLRITPADWVGEDLVGLTKFFKKDFAEEPVFFGGHEYRFTVAWQHDGLEVVAAETTPVTGEIRIEGDAVKCLVAEGPLLAFVDDLAQPVQLPVGGYRNARVFVDGGGPATVYMSYREGFSVDENTPALLKCGAPLRQEAIVNRFAGYLCVDYGLRGVGGETYTQSQRGNPPGLSIRKGDTELASGKFEYG